MPYRFIYENTNEGDETEFSGNLVCGRCAHINVNKNPPARCKRYVCIGLDICWQHLEQVKHLKIRQSGLEYAGKGLFAFNKRVGADAVIFRNNDIICEYIGESVNDAQLTARYGEEGTAPDAVDSGIGGQNIDSALQRGVGALVNHARGNQTNCRFRNNTRNNRVFIVATKNILNTRELFLDYGVLYNLNPEDETYRTKYVRR